MKGKPPHHKAKRPSRGAHDARHYTGRNTFKDATGQMIREHMARVEADMVRMERKTLEDMGHDASHVQGIDDVMWH